MLEKLVLSTHILMEDLCLTTVTFQLVLEHFNNFHILVLDNQTININLKKNKTLQLNIVDSAGQEDIDLIRMFLEADVILLCYSSVSVTSFKNIEKFWLPKIKEFFEDVSILFVGTKTDLYEDEKEQNQVKERDAINLATTLRKSISLRCSAKEWGNTKRAAGNLDVVFEKAIKMGLTQKGFLKNKNIFNKRDTKLICTIL